MQRYLWNVLLGLDQLLSTLTGGDPDETVSSRVGKAAQAGNRAGLAMEWCLDRVFGKGHCRSSVEADEGKDRLARW